MDNFISESSFLTLVFNVVFYLSALLSFACAASSMLFGVVYRNDSLLKSVFAIVLGIAILVGVAWGLETLNWTAPREVSLAAALVVGPSWLVLIVGFISLLIIECSRSVRKK